MKDIQLFHFDGSQVRTLLLNGEPWFVARDVCSILEIGNTSDAVRRLDKDEFDSIEVTDSLGRKQASYIVNEAGLFSLILGSRKPEARTFKRWVTHEVLPSIRRTGTYSVYPKSPAEMLLEMAKQFVVQEQRMNQLEMQLQVTQRRIDTLDHVDVIGDKQQRLVAMVKKVAHQNGWTFRHAWREFTGSFNTAYRTNLTQRIEHYKAKHGLKELSRPQYLSIVGELDDAIRVADKMLNHVPVGV